MITFEEVLALVQPLKADQLSLWIERRWVRPEQHGGEIRFADVDIARIRLIHDIHYTMEVAPDTVPIMLSLIDQLYAARRQMRGVMSAINTLSPDLRDAVLANLREEAQRDVSN